MTSAATKKRIKGIFDEYSALPDETTDIINYAAETLATITDHKDAIPWAVQVLTILHTEIRKIHTNQEWLQKQLLSIIDPNDAPIKDKH